MPFWGDQVRDRLATGPVVVNDSKTPSGRAHVGALRGVLIHDAIARFAAETRDDVTYLFGSDDFDPLDEIPFGMDDLYRPHLGKPLCDVPAPPGSEAGDLAEHFISEFFGLFPQLGVTAQTYRMRDHYRAGRFDGAIATILDHRDEIRSIYEDVSGSVKPPSWYPIQVICERCGRIGTTIATGYSDRTVSYECRPDLVEWAHGCGHAGEISPFGGNAKLPWKLEWAAKWMIFPVTVEGAGKDHNTKGGSRDVAETVARRVLRIEPPQNVPYEFFLLGGAKMSSSKGLGVSAHDMVDLLPPEAVRFLMIRTPPKTALNFDPTVPAISRVFAEMDSLADDSVVAYSAEIRSLISLSPHADYVPHRRLSEQLPWDVIVSLTQLPHVDVLDEAARRFDPPLSTAERTQLDERIQAADRWVTRFLPERERITLQTGITDSAGQLGPAGASFVSAAADRLATCEWTAEAIQSCLYDVARLTPINPKLAFEALYTVLLDRPSGPRAGNLLAFLDRDPIVSLLGGVAVSEPALLEATALDPDAFLDQLGKAVRKDPVRTAAFRLRRAQPDARPPAGSTGEVVAVDLTIVPDSGRARVLRSRLAPPEAADAAAADAINGDDEAARFEALVAAASAIVLDRAPGATITTDGVPAT